MNPHSGQAPVSVGALIDTSFVRRAAMDANDERDVERKLQPALHLRWIGAMRALAGALRRH